MSQHFPELYKHSGKNLKVDLKLSYYATKADFASMKTKEDNLDVDKLETVPADVIKLNNVVDNDIVKKLCTIIGCQSQCY